MGWRFRKSINLGGFRINFSKSGIGYSFGIMGLRYTKKANGGTRITSSIRGTGISYSKDYSAKKKVNYSEPQTSNIEENDDSFKVESHLIQSKPNELVAKLNEAYEQNKKNTTKKILIGIGAFLSLCYIATSAIALIPFIGLLVWYFMLPKKISIDLDYDFTENKEMFEKYNNLQKGIDDLLSNSKLCEITSIKSNTDYKNQAGAKSLLSTSANIKIIRNIKYIDTDLDLQVIKIQNKQLLLLPDIMLVYQDKQWISVNYDELEVLYQDTRFIESGFVPNDTQVLDYTWQHVNKSGGPDKRFANNRKLPICAYGEVGFESKNGLLIMIMGSNRQKTKSFYEALNEYIA